MKTIYINDESLSKYQNLFFWAGKIIGRLFFKNKGAHRNFRNAIRLFHREYANPTFGFYDYSKNEFDDLGFDPASDLLEILADRKKKSSLDDFTIFEACEKFFYDVVFNVARKEQIKIKYHFLVGDRALYGINSHFNRFKNQEDYLHYLETKGLTSDYIEADARIVNPSNYEY